jgi:glutamate 5-kinase
MAKSKKRWVIKAGSNIVCSGGPLLVRAWMQQVAQLRRKFGIEVIWVTSGAIASAVDRTEFRKRNRKLSEKQALSAIGQPLVMDLYNIALQTSGLLGAQILLTYSDLADRERCENFHNTLEELLSWGVVPVLNENDAVATEEIKFGDNDSLSAKVARVAQADRLLILTDVAGLYDSDPNSNPDAQLIPRLKGVDAKLLRALEGSSKASAKASGKKKNNRGTGGMYSKIRAAAEASKNGTETWLVRGDLPSVLLQAAENQSVGTVIEAQRKKRRRSSK